MRLPSWRSWSLRSLIEPLPGLMAWVYIYLAALLGMWVLLASLLTGWSPAIITSGSMQPTLRPGDVVLLEEHPDALVAQRTVITFRPRDDPESLVTHRVYSVEEAGYVTKGDANPTPDTDPVPVESVEGVARLVVPLVGLPMLWMLRGDTIPLVAWALTTLGALAVALANMRRMWRRKGASEGRHTAMAAKAVRRVRTLVGAMIVSQFVIDPSRFEIDGVGIARWHVLLVAMALLFAINTASVVASRAGDSAQVGRVSIIELVGDTVMVVLLTTATGTGGIGWVLFALPIIEAAARFRLAGALMHWMVLTGVALASRIWVIEHTSTATTGLIDELERMLDQLSVLLLVVIPGAHLIEQLTNDILAQRRVTDDAVERGRMLQHVAETSRDVNRLGSEVFESITGAVLELGFQHTDVVARVADGKWNVLADAGTLRLLPTPGEAASALRPDDLATWEVFVDAEDPDPGDATALGGTGAALLVRINLSTRDDTIIALRAAVTDRAQLRSGGIEAFRLLAGQATVALQNEHLVTELQTIHDEMEHQATHDSLTRLPNRAHFLDRLGRALEDATAPDRRHAVLFMDLDGFKPVNDTLGHEVGDHLLQAIAERLEAEVGGRGLAARLGGDEFTVLLEPVPSPAAGEAIASEIQHKIRQPYRIGATTVQVDVSIGIAYAEVGVSAPELLRRADAAMYAAKSRQERPSLVTYHQELDAADRRRARMTDEFTKALRSDGLSLHYQPLMSATTGAVAGVEALIRWTHRDLGAINAGSILDLAEGATLMPELNRWIMRRAATDAKSWGVPADHRFFVAVNAAPEELASPFFVRNVTETLQVSGLAPHNLVVELSERIVGSDQAHAENIWAVTELGVRLALDDFGEGKTSLAHLRGLPISMLKLDRVLVQNAVRSRPDRVILESISGLAHELGYEVVAEGIETEEHRATCVGAGADLLQGYLLHRPMPPEDIAALLKRSGTEPEVPGERAERQHTARQLVGQVP